MRGDVSGQGRGAVVDGTVRHAGGVEPFLWVDTAEMPAPGQNVEMLLSCRPGGHEIVIDFDAWRTLIDAGTARNRRIRIVVHADD